MGSRGRALSRKKKKTKSSLPMHNVNEVNRGSAMTPTFNLNASSTLVLLVLLVALQLSYISSYNNFSPSHSRRQLFERIVTAAGPAFVAPSVANAIDPSLLKQLKTLPIEGDDGSSRLAGLAALQQSQINDDPELVDIVEGVQTREYKVGNGAQVVSDSSRVGLEMTVRCATVTSDKEPNGALIYSTQKDDELGEIILKMGDRSVPDSIEKSLKGMSKGGIRRIYLSSQKAYEWKNSYASWPSPKGDREQRLVERIFTGKADLIVEVKVNRIRETTAEVATATDAPISETAVAATTDASPAASTAATNIAAGETTFVSSTDAAVARDSCSCGEAVCQC